MQAGETLPEFQARLGRMTKAECVNLSDEDLNRASRADAVYGKAMAAMEAAQALPPCTSCKGEYGYADETCCGRPFCFRCLLRHQDRGCAA